MDHADVLAKIPFLLASELFIHVSLTPPNPPPKPEESKKYAVKWTLRETSIFNLPNVAIVLRVSRLLHK